MKTDTGAIQVMLKDFDKDCIHKEALDLCQGWVLSIGCGYGREIKYLLSKGCNVVGIDIDRDAIKSCVKYNCCLIRGNFLEHNFINTYDNITCIWNTLFYFKHEDRRAVILKALNLLNPKGKLIITVSQMTMKRWLWNLKHGEHYYATDRELEKYLEGLDYQMLDKDGAYRIVVNQ